LIDRVEQQWAPPGDPIFDLVPPIIHEHISAAYNNIGRPAVDFNSFWDVYDWLRDAADVAPLSQAASDALEAQEPDSAGEVNPLLEPYANLQRCEFGKNGIPSLQQHDSAVASA
jgi:hypothetical protein